MHPIVPVVDSTGLIAARTGKGMFLSARVHDQEILRFGSESNLYR